MRDRAQELLDEEASLASTLAVTWDASADDDFPRLSLPFDRLLAHTKARRGVGAADARRARHAACSRRPRSTPSSATPTRSARRLRSLVSEGYRVVLAAEGTGSAQRLHDVLAAEGVDAASCSSPVRSSSRRSTAAWCCRRRSSRSSPKPTSPAAAACTAAPRGARRGTDYYDALEPGDYVVHHVHGVGRYVGMKPLTMVGLERDYLSSSTRRRQGLRARPTRSGWCASTPAARRRRSTAWAAPTGRRSGRGSASAVREIAEELVVLYRQRLATPGHAFAPDTPWQHEIEEAFPYEETPDQLQAIDEVKADMERPIPMDRLVCGDVGYGKTEVAVRAAFKAVQDGKQVAGARADHAAREPARPDVPRAVRQLPGAGRGAVAVPVAQGAERGRPRTSTTARSTS